MSCEQFELSPIFFLNESEGKLKIVMDIQARLNPHVKGNKNRIKIIKVEVITVFID